MVNGFHIRRACPQTGLLLCSQLRQEHLAGIDYTAEELQAPRPEVVQGVSIENVTCRQPHTTVQQKLVLIVQYNIDRIK